jgi:hypothetical protein
MSLENQLHVYKGIHTKSLNAFFDALDESSLNKEQFRMRCGMELGPHLDSDAAGSFDSATDVESVMSSTSSRDDTSSSSPDTCPDSYQDSASNEVYSHVL